MLSLKTHLRQLFPLNHIIIVVRFFEVKMSRRKEVTALIDRVKSPVIATDAKLEAIDQLKKFATADPPVCIPLSPSPRP